MPNRHPSDLACIAKISDCMCQIAEELHKLIITKFKKRKLNSSFKDNIWGGKLADMQLISKYNVGF